MEIFPSTNVIIGFVGSFAIMVGVTWYFLDKFK